jgi:hypothetical protein
MRVMLWGIAACLLLILFTWVFQFDFVKGW